MRNLEPNHCTLDSRSEPGMTNTMPFQSLDNSIQRYSRKKKVQSGLIKMRVVNVLKKCLAEAFDKGFISKIDVYWESESTIAIEVPSQMYAQEVKLREQVLLGEVRSKARYKKNFFLKVIIKRTT